MFAALNASAATPEIPRTEASNEVRMSPTTRLMSVPAAITAPERPTLWAGALTPVSGESLPGEPGDPALVGEGEVAVGLGEEEPRDVDRLVVGVLLDGEVPAGGLEEVVVDVLVDAAVAGGEPVVDGAELDEDAALDAGLLLDLAHGRLGEGLLPLDVALRQAPLDASGPVAPGDDGDPGVPVVDVDDDAARAALLDRREPPGARPGRIGSGVAHPVTVTTGARGGPTVGVARRRAAGVATATSSRGPRST